MTLTALAIIGVTIIFSSFVSGVFGMAGGMVLLGVLLVYLDVATGMVLFSIIQLGTNGWRALHYRQFVLWPIFWCYVLGALIAFAGTTETITHSAPARRRSSPPHSSIHTPRRTSRSAGLFPGRAAPDRAC